MLEHVLPPGDCFSRVACENALTTAQDVFISGEVRRGLAEGTLPLEAGELRRRRADDAPGDVLLHAEDVLDLGVEAPD